MKKQKLLCYLLALSMVTGLCPITAKATALEETAEQKIIYSDDEMVRFEGKEPVYAEAAGRNVLKITRTEKLDESSVVKVQV